MGAEPYFYFVPYEPDVNAALQKLRQREFQAGRYNPVIPTVFDLFPLGPHSPAPGAQHASIEEALADSDADGTRSILDLDHISNVPDCFAVTPLDEKSLKALYGTNQPTQQMVEANMDFFEEIERGQGICFIVYKDGKPDEILFAGYSCD